VKLKIDMLNTSMGSCLDARVRKSLRSLLLKLFSCCLVFIVYENFKRNSVPHHETLAGFFSTSFEGENKSGNVTAGSYTFHAANSINYCEILMKSASKAFGEGAANLGISSEPVTSYRIFEQVMFRCV
jgi:hypothetical protein